MNLSDALSKAVLGCRLWREGLGDNNYLYYNFKGFDLAKGSFEMSDEDKAADWQVIGTDIDEAPEDFVQVCWNVLDGVNKIDPEEVYRGE